MRLIKALPSMLNKLTVLKSIAAISVIAIGAGCASPTLEEQVYLSHPDLLFSDSPTLAYNGALMSTIEPGTADSSGASATGCSACQ